MKRYFSFLLTAMVIGGMAISCGGNKNGVEPGPGPDTDPDPDPDPTPEVITDYYVSVEGSGTKDGTSAQNAMGMEEIRSLLLQPMVEGEDGEGNPILVQDDEQAFANAQKLDGMTIHLADGTYILNNLKIEFNGYEKPVAFTIEGSQNAILSGNNTSRVLLIGNQVDLTLQGMSIQGGNLENDISQEGAGIYIAAGESGSAKVTAKGTLFDGNRCLGANDDNKGNSGGAVGVAKGTFIAEDCVFGTENFARNGASIYTKNNEALVQATRCTFKSKSHNTGGAANNSKGKQYYYDCIFDGCSTLVGAGAAIHANAAGSIVVAERCTFKNCTPRANEATTESKAAGVISVQTSDVTLNDCTFTDCFGGAGSLILLQANDGLLKCNNTVFKNNTGYDRGLIQVNGSKSNDIANVAFFNNCRFYDNKLKTNKWGLILHGSTPSAACFNNCTFVDNVREQAGGNGVCLNTDGSIVLVNSTLIESDDLVSLRANNNDARNCFLVVNSIVLNTSSGKPFIASDKLQPALSSSYNSILGSTYSAPTQYKSNNDILDATAETLGGSVNATSKLYVWNGPGESFTKLAAADFENILKTGASQRISNKEHPYLGTKSLGEAFYEWLVSIGAVGKDAAGTDRGASWWPGAYQAN